MLHNLINEKVLEGVLPIAFFNSKIIVLESNNFNKVKVNNILRPIHDATF